MSKKQQDEAIRICPSPDIMNKEVFPEENKETENLHKSFLLSVECA